MNIKTGHRRSTNKNQKERMKKKNTKKYGTQHFEATTSLYTHP